MEVAQLQIRYIKYAESLFNEGYLDDLFTQLQKFQDANDPRFVIKVISTYFEDSEKTLSDLNRTMDQQPIDFKKVDPYVQKLKGSSSRDQQPIDFKKVDAYVQKLKGSSSSIGAQRVANACIAFRSSYLKQKNTEACMRCAAQIKQEYAIVKEMLQNLFRLEQQIVEAGGAVPVLHN